MNLQEIEFISSDILIGAEAIMKFLKRADGSPISRPTFLRFIQMGMPAALINKTWYGHKKNIDQWFRVRTNQDNRKKDIPEDFD